MKWIIEKDHKIPNDHFIFNFFIKYSEFIFRIPNSFHKQKHSNSKRTPKLFYKFQFYYFNTESENFDIMQIPSECKFVIIDEYIDDDFIYYIVCFEYKLIIIQQEFNLFSDVSVLDFVFL